MKVLLLTPPFTQLNTPYPATAYLKGFLRTLGIPAHQADLGIEVILRLFTAQGLREMFAHIEASEQALSENAYRICNLCQDYIATIDPVMAFLQHRDPTLAHSICDRSYLPEASRFKQLGDLEWAFGTLGIQDQARHLATLYLEDLGDLIQEAIDPHFGFSRYAERLGRTATHFAPLHQALQAPETLISTHLTDILAEKMALWQPDVVCLSVPFPGNLFGAFKCGQYLRQHHPAVKVVLGGGFANTELRRLSDPQVFDYIHYVCLDDGEAPLKILLEHLEGQRPQNSLKRTYVCEDGQVHYLNAAPEKDIPQRETGTPDYSDLPLDRYLSVIEIANPMHRLWSDGRWNKLTLAHGCYWGKCSFCDVSLDYIQRYEPINAGILCDRIEEIIAQTGQRGFHFVDEAAPPALMRDLALEILRRGITLTWWTNIRFEKRFTPDLCRLLKASGCIAISGGLEVASDRLLDKMKKGVTVEQVARVADAFTRAGIMVHAYLMYGFPTQTAQETIDSLERVRQMFETGVLQSAYWHRFAMTAHSPVGLQPAAYGVLHTGPDFGGFADNDLYHDDPEGADHDLFAEGLRTSLFNYMHGIGFDFPLSRWFDFKTPKPTVAADFVAQSIDQPESVQAGASTLLLWTGHLPNLEYQEDGTVALEIFTKRQDLLLELDPRTGQYLHDLLTQAHTSAPSPCPWTTASENFPSSPSLPDWQHFWESAPGRALREAGLLLV